MGVNNYLKYSRSDGSFWSFGFTGNSWIPAAPSTEIATLIQGATTWTLTFQSGEKRIFDLTTGHLLSIVDRNGNTTQLTYDGSNRLTTITDPVGRQLTLGYASSSSFLVTGITSTVAGITFTYTYDTQNRLTQVTRPDLTTLNYTYNALSQITSVTDMNGKVLESHTYDSGGRGLTAADANGIQAVTLSY